MIRRTLTSAVIAIAAVVAPLISLAPVAVAVQDETYISNPPFDPDDQDFCDDQATLANNLAARGDQMGADGVVAAANMKGCRIFTFQSR
ncbi:hypothetical protein [Rhodococcus sp. NPDC049939]|uniref:hypothetical protein n=1 Tax=Rhodococcus sp. NPDC049939 TaxID=3155511 RepID=UPI0033DEF015